MVRATRALLGALLLLAAAAATSAAYRPLAPEGWAVVEDGWARSVVAAARRAVGTAAAEDAQPLALGSHHRGADDKAYIAIRYMVPHDLRDKFIDEWRKLEDKAQHRKGNCVFDLKEAVDDDMLFLGYGEWESFEDLAKHAESDEARDFEMAVRDMDIAWHLQPLYQPKNAGELMKGSNRCQKGPSSDVDRRGKRRMAHALVRYFAPPSAHKDLIDAWHTHLDDTSKEEGIRIFSLRKVMNNNHEWYGYGTWDSIEDLHHHMESDHTRRLHDRLGDLNVHWHLTHLRKIGSQSE